MTRNITIHDLARALNVTASTISRALNDSPRVSAEMRRRVRLLAEEMRYEHNHLAASLRVGRSQIIGVIVPTANRSFFSNVVRGIEAVAQEYDYRVVICQSNDDPPEEERIINTLLRMRVDGILISIARETQAFAHLEKVIEKNVPLVMFDRVKPLDGAAIAALDDRMGGYEATRHLIEQGYTRIAHFAGPQHINI
ncbi:MAG: LacI family DNA-binding transcriptional regulator, partial [Saprospiraceae bacterium]